MSGNTVPVLWYENVDGQRWYPPRDFNGDEVPDGFEYQHYRNPFEVRDQIATREGSLGSGGSTYSGPLALAMCRPSWREMFWQLVRYGSFARTMPLDAAILRACGCERCNNADLHRYGIDGGYRKGSAAYVRSNTECEYCRG